MKEIEISNTINFLFKNDGEYKLNTDYKKYLKSQLNDSVLNTLLNFKSNKLLNFYQLSYIDKTQSHKKYYNAKCIEFEDDYILVHDEVKVILTNYLLIFHMNYFKENYYNHESEMTLSILSEERNNIFYFDNFNI